MATDHIWKASSSTVPNHLESEDPFWTKNIMKPNMQLVVRCTSDAVNCRTNCRLLGIIPVACWEPLPFIIHLRRITLSAAATYFCLILLYSYSVSFPMYYAVSVDFIKNSLFSIPRTRVAVGHLIQSLIKL